MGSRGVSTRTGCQSHHRIAPSRVPRRRRDFAALSSLVSRFPPSAGLRCAQLSGLAFPAVSRFPLPAGLRYAQLLGLAFPAAGGTSLRSALWSRVSRRRRDFAALSSLVSRFPPSAGLRYAQFSGLAFPAVSRFPLPAGLRYAQLSGLAFPAVSGTSLRSALWSSVSRRLAFPAVGGTSLRSVLWSRVSRRLAFSRSPPSRVLQTSSGLSQRNEVMTKRRPNGPVGWTTGSPSATGVGIRCTTASHQARASTA